jgi:orotate phosphoribosyltransferase
VVTSGGRIVLSVADLRAAGAEIDVAVALSTGDRADHDPLAAAGLELRSALTGEKIEAA